MGHFSRLVCVLALMLHGVVRASAQAQWSAAFQVGADRFWGVSIDNTAEHRSFRPYRPTTFAAALQRRGKLGFTLRLAYAEAGMGLEGEGAVVAVKDVFTIYSVAPALSYQVATIGAENSLSIAAGPVFEVWRIADLSSRTRLGGQTSIGLAVPLSRKFAATISGSVAVISSPFAGGELPPEYELRASWRRSLAGGLEYRF